MTVPPATRALVAELLLPGEDLEYLFPALVPVSLRGDVLVAVTARAITVFSTSGPGGRPTSVMARYSRRTGLGPVDLEGVASFILGGIRFEVDDEYVPVVHAVDAERAGADALPPDPLPDL